MEAKAMRPLKSVSNMSTVCRKFISAWSLEMPKQTQLPKQYQRELVMLRLTGTTMVFHWQTSRLKFRNWFRRKSRFIRITWTPQVLLIFTISSVLIHQVWAKSSRSTMNKLRRISQILLPIRSFQVWEKWLVEMPRNECLKDIWKCLTRRNMFEAC